MTTSKLKPKDESTNKFLQRLAGKKAIGPPPTPRPVIGEHPVRILMRENRDVEETFEQSESATAESLQTTPASSLFATDQAIPQPPTSLSITALEANEVGHKQTDVEEFANKIKTPYSTSAIRKLDQKIVTISDAKDVRLTSLDSDALSFEVNTEAVVTTTVSTDSAEAHLSDIKKKFRLNSGEFAVYKELYLMTHAVGKTECSFVVSELMKSTNMLERRVRDNIRRLKENNWIVLLEGYDFESREKPRYRVNSKPEFS